MTLKNRGCAVNKSNLSVVVVVLGLGACAHRATVIQCDGPLRPINVPIVVVHPAQPAAEANTQAAKAPQ